MRYHQWNPLNQLSQSFQGLVRKRDYIHTQLKVPCLRKCPQFRCILTYIEIPLNTNTQTTLMETCTYMSVSFDSDCIKKRHLLVYKYFKYVYSGTPP